MAVKETRLIVSKSSENANNEMATFTRKFTADLSEGNMGGFKGVIFEVLEATNFEIAYKIKRHFPRLEVV